VKITMSDKEDIRRILFVFGCIWISVSILCYGLGMDAWYCKMGALIGVCKLSAGMVL
jgi:hypothetical protein